MNSPTLTTLHIEAAGIAHLQDLGRPGWAHLGVAAAGAVDQHAAAIANLLVGNPATATLVEIIGSSFTFLSPAPLLIAATGPVRLETRGQRQPTWCPLFVEAHTPITVSVVDQVAAYVAINGQIRGQSVFASVAPDPYLGTGSRLRAGMKLQLASRLQTIPSDHYARLFRLSLPLPQRSSGQVTLLPGPEFDWLKSPTQLIDSAWVVQQESNQVGIRLHSDPLQFRRRPAPNSRGVPVGAVELLPTGALVVLLRARLATAGYPIIGVLTRSAVDQAGQLRPGDSIRLRLIDDQEAQRQNLQRRQLRELVSRRVATAFTSSGLGRLLADPDSTS